MEEEISGGRKVIERFMHSDDALCIAFIVGWTIFVGIVIAFISWVSVAMG